MNDASFRSSHSESSDPFTRRQWLRHTASWAAAAGLPAAVWDAPRATADEHQVPTHRETFQLRQLGKKIPVIFDTDIGGDIDDTWALVYLMKCPELDVKLLVSDAGNTIYRARIMAKMMEIMDRADMPIAIGLSPADRTGNQSAWVQDYALDKYPGPIHQDGVAAMVDVINRSPDPITVIAIGGVPTVAAALRRDPTIVNKARFVGMHGSIRRGYGDGSQPVAEANVRTDPAALRTVFSAPWECSVTPLDTCDRVVLGGERYQRVYRCPRPEVRALMENYRIWSAPWVSSNLDRSRQSSTLFDLVAVYMAYSEELLKMETLPLRVTDEGMTLIDPSQRPVRCAVDWNDLEAFQDEIVQRITAG